jgi:hypothetical protein
MPLHDWFHRLWLKVPLALAVLAAVLFVTVGAMPAGFAASATRATEPAVSLESTESQTKPKSAADVKAAADGCVVGSSKLNDQACRSFQHDAVQVPEPASLFLVGVGLISIGAIVRRRLLRRQSS